VTLSNIRPSILSLTPSDSLVLVIAARKVVTQPRKVRLPSVAKAKTEKPKRPRSASVASLSKAQLELLIQELERG
jgi:hypothetical protein